jgi:hypothetical protein
VTRLCVSTVLGFYTARVKKEGVAQGQSGAVVVVQRTSSDLKLNPHLHIIFLDGVYRELDASTVTGSPTSLGRGPRLHMDCLLSQARCRVPSTLRCPARLSLDDENVFGSPRTARCSAKRQWRFYLR